MGSVKLINIGELVTFDSTNKKMIRMKNPEIVIEEDKIYEIGYTLGSTDTLFDCCNMLVTPGFVDSHTHPVFLNYRDNEYNMRLQGASYEEISAAGGGIINSVQDVRNSSMSELILKVEQRMDRFLNLGTTTVECKSGYGLSKESEVKSLEVIHEVNKNHKIDMIPTFMGAHAFPFEYKNDHDGYVNLICDEILPEIASKGLARFNDVFCENGFFNADQTKAIINTGRKLGLYPRIHADEFIDSGAAKLAGELNIVSADHLMAVSDEGIQSLADGNVIATLLPGTTFFLGKSQYAPYEKIKNCGVDVALASDFNPGSCNIQSMPFIITLSCIYLKMDILDAIKSSTYVSAKSLMLEDQVGSIEKGKVADILIWRLKQPEQIPYYFLNNSIRSVIKNGKVVFTA
tara:strand:- start:872 stop:2080 length:1209 start_codon:yes stop_codon:yes gene_type:complete